ncbi:non-ribosomal peptide synthetase [Streptomyces sp. LaPpAH-108]|uniref:non-ribosomal peptide synthetase n=1 Tax=Streptomyces sp. LaPpAH-108 TaxID=1155714 RepID=UPI00039FFA17|nr:non-ribosomal peptide synthetase [Streptomyces sp. LaPpAH-108]
MSQEELRRHLARRLRLDPAEIGDDDDLVGLGLDSVTAMAMVGAWRDAGLTVTYREFTVSPTVSDWWALLADGRPEKPPVAEAAETVAAIDPAAPFLLTPVQYAYWIGRNEGQVLGGVACHGYFEFDGPGADPARLEDAVHRLTERHGMLRAVIRDDGRQQITARSPWPGLIYHDLRSLSTEAVEKRLRAIRDELSHRLLDIRTGEVFDIQLSLLPGGGARLHLNVDLIIADVMSIQVLLADLAALYRGVDLPPLTLSFAEYLADRTNRRRAEREQARAHWRERSERLTVGGPRLPLATDPARVARPRFRRRSHLLEQARFDQLKERARAHRVTPSMVLATAFAEALGQWSENRRFLLSVPLFDRQAGDPDTERMIADFTNLILLEVETGGTAPFVDRVRALQDRFQQDVSYAAYSAVEVLRDLARGRTDGPVSAPVVFASSIGELFVDDDFRGLFGEMSWMLSQTPQVWLDHQLYETTDGLLLTWDTVDALFPDGLVDAMFAAYTDLVQRLAEDERAWTGPVARALPPAQAARRAKINATTAPVPEGLLHDGVITQARRTPDRTAVVAADRSLTYGELLGRAEAVAELLRERGRCTTGEIVAVAMPKGWQQIVGVIGALLAGCAYLPLDTAQPTARRDRILADAGVRQVLVCESGPGPADWPEQVRVDAVDGLTSAATPSYGERPRPEDLAYVIYTSGSSGTPKGVMISHRSALNTVVDINTRHGVDEDDRILGLAGLGFDLSVYDVFGPLARGGALVLPDPDRRGDPSHWAALIHEHRVTLWNSVPAQLQMLDDCLGPTAEWDLSRLRLALISGDWIPVTLPDSIRSKLPGLCVISLGGATEAAIWSIHFPIDTVDEEWTSIPYGTPLANQTFHVLDAEDPALPPRPDWVTGELYIGGIGLALGYLGDPERTAERFVHHPVTGERLYRTGDLGRYRPDGVIEFLGRADSQVKVLGHRIEPGEIESTLERHPSVGVACVLADGGRTDRRLVAFVTGRHRTPAAGSAAELAAASDAAGRSAAKAPDAARMRAFHAALDEAVLLTVGHALREALAEGRTADEMLRLMRAVPRHRWIVHRWLGLLHEAGQVTHDPMTGMYTAVPGALPDSRSEVDAAWRRVRELHAYGHDQWSPEAVALFERSGARLPELVSGAQDEVHLLFPEGRADTAVSLFTDSLIARYTNAATAGALREIALSHSPDHGPLRVLEVGAGVGGTSAAAFEALADQDVEYLFTDVSPFFLNGAQERFADVPFVDYGLFDMNADPRSQGLAPNSFDVIVAANVLHNARNAATMLGRLRELLTPGGWLLFTEPTRESAELMIFMAFLMDVGETGVDFTDVRRGQDRMLLDREEWTQLLQRAGATELWHLPQDPGPDADRLPPSLGQVLLAARFKADQTRVSPDALGTYLADQLPAHMVPSRTHVLDALPLTANGKVDRGALAAWLRAAPDPAATRKKALPPRDALEDAIAGLWAEVLGAGEQVGVDQDFFAVGGDSLLAAQLIGNVREQVPGAAGHGFEVLLRCLIEYRSIEALAAAVRQPPVSASGAEPGR